MNYRQSTRDLETSQPLSVITRCHHPSIKTRAIINTINNNNQSLLFHYWDNQQEINTLSAFQYPTSKRMTQFKIHVKLKSAFHKYQIYLDSGSWTTNSTLAILITGCYTGAKISVRSCRDGESEIFNKATKRNLWREIVIDFWWLTLNKSQPWHGFRWHLQFAGVLQTILQLQCCNV